MLKSLLEDRVKVKVHVRPGPCTHGRGIWIIDDISPWRALTSEVVREAMPRLSQPVAR